MDIHLMIQDLLSDFGFKRTFAHELQLFTGPLTPGAYDSRTIAREIAATATPQGTVEALVRSLVHGEPGYWLYAGWIDQAILHVGAVRPGEMEYFGTMLAQIDDDQVDQGGDMLVAFVRQDHDWVLTIEASPEDSVFEIRLRTDHESEATRARNHVLSNAGA